MDAIMQKMLKANENKRASALKEVKRLHKEFSYTTGILKGSLNKDRKLKN